MNVQYFNYEGLLFEPNNRTVVIQLLKECASTGFSSSYQELDFHRKALMLR